MCVAGVMSFSPSRLIPRTFGALLVDAYRRIAVCTRTTWQSFESSIWARGTRPESSLGQALCIDSVGVERIRLGARLGILGHAALAGVDAAYEDLERRLAAYRARTAAELSAELAREGETLTLSIQVGARD